MGPNNKRGRELASDIALVALGWGIGLVSEELLPATFPRLARILILVALFALTAWFVFLRSSYYDKAQASRKEWVGVIAIAVATISLGFGIKSILCAPSPEEVIKEKVRGWIADLDPEFSETKPLDGDVFQFNFKVPKRPESDRMTAHAVLNRKTNLILVGIKARDKTFAKFADCLPPPGQDVMKQELDKFWVSLGAEARNAFVRTDKETYALQSFVELEADTVTRSQFVTASNLAYNQMQLFKLTMSELMKKFGRFTIEGENPRICTASPCQCTSVVPGSKPVPR